MSLTFQIHSLPIRETDDGPIHIPQKEPQEKGDGVLLNVHVCQIPP